MKSPRSIENLNPCSEFFQTPLVLDQRFRNQNCLLAVAAAAAAAAAAEAWLQQHQAASSSFSSETEVIYRAVIPLEVLPKLKFYLSTLLHHMDAYDQQDWSELCEELIGEIAKQLPSIEDFVRFGSVCQSWRSVTVQKQHYYPTSLQFSADGGGCCLPWLMLRERKNEDDDDNTTRDFFDPWNNKMYHLNLPETTRGARCSGSPYGWLITMGLDLNIVLMNPITRVQIHLPPQSAFQDQYNCYCKPEYLRQYFIRKVVIAPPSLTTSPDRFLAMALYSQFKKLAVAKPGDKGWTTLDTSVTAFKDTIYFGCQFFAVNTLGDVYICEVSGPHPPKATFFVSAPEDVEPVENFYLLDLAGELHKVVRIYGEVVDEKSYPCINIHHTKFFEVYRLDLQSRKWTELMSFDDHALFVGDNTAFSVSTTRHPECKGNCIYFTDDSYECNNYDFGRDTGVFDFKEETIRPFDIVHGNDSLSSFSGPVWITPNLW